MEGRSWRLKAHPGEIRFTVPTAIPRDKKLKATDSIEYKLVHTGQRGEAEVMQEPLSFMGEPGPEKRIRKLVFTFTFKKDVQFDEPRDGSFHGGWVIEAGGFHE